MDDVVVIRDDNQPRTLWTLGVVDELMYGKDGKCRGAAVCYVKNGKRLKISRLINKLYPVKYKPKK